MRQLAAAVAVTACVSLLVGCADQEPEETAAPLSAAAVAPAVQEEAGGPGAARVLLDQLEGIELVLDIEFTGTAEATKDDEFVTVPIVVRSAPGWKADDVQSPGTLPSRALLATGWQPTVGATTSVAGWVIRDAAAASAFGVPTGTLMVVVATPDDAVGAGPATQRRLWRAWSKVTAAASPRAKLIRMARAARALRNEAGDDSAAEILDQAIEGEFGTGQVDSSGDGETAPPAEQLPTSVQDLGAKAAAGLRDRHFVIEVDPGIRPKVTYLAIRFADGRTTVPNSIDQEYNIADVMTAAPESPTATILAWTSPEPQPGQEVVWGAITLPSATDSAVLGISGTAAAGSVSLIDSGEYAVAQGWLTDRVTS